MLSLILLSALTVSTAEPTTNTTSEANVVAIRAKRLHLVPGQVIQNGVVLIRDGRIFESGAGVAIPPGVTPIEHDGDASAGLIALHDYSGTAGENLDSTREFLPEAELAHAFDPDHSDFGRLVDEGITAIVLAPGPTAVAGGIASVVKTGTGRVLKRRSMLDLSFASVSLSRNRFPTSYDAAISELDAHFESPKGAFAEAIAGRMGVLLRVSARHEVQRALDFAKRHGLKGSLSGASRSGELAESIKASELAVILPPYSPGATHRWAKSAVQLADAGVRFGFGLDAPSRHPASLRAGAAFAMREGLSADAAFGALTLDAARIAGVPTRLGALTAGMDGDVVLWSGHPLDLGSSVVAVYVDGELAHGGDE